MDRIIILRINTEEREIETLLDAPIANALELMTPETGGKRAISLSRLVVKRSKLGAANTVSEIRHGAYTLRDLENGSIEADCNGKPIVPVKPVLRVLAAELNIGLLNGSGNPHNTRQLGSQVMKSVQELQASS